MNTKKSSKQRLTVNSECKAGFFDWYEDALDKIAAASLSAYSDYLRSIPNEEAINREGFREYE